MKICVQLGSLEEATPAETEGLCARRTSEKVTSGQEEAGKAFLEGRQNHFSPYRVEPLTEGFAIRLHRLMTLTLV